MVKKTEAISRFLAYSTHGDLASLYNFNMEVQVNVAQDEGQRIEGEFKGKKWIGYSDEFGNEWKAFRIPYNANSKPEYEDHELKFDLVKHAEGIGLTGWDWFNKLSRWVAFDFDGITGHSEKHTKKLTDIELKEIRDAISNIDWCTIRYSTSGNGLHIYVMLDPPIPTNTHTEHAALARSILGMLSSKTNSNLEAKIDACGQNMWIWHRKMKGTNGLQVIKQGKPLNNVPANWKDHLTVISGKRKRVLPSFVDESSTDMFDQLSGQRSRVILDDSHKKLINYLENSKFTSWYDVDNNMLVTHTYALKEAFTELELIGIYDTVSNGNDSTQNCFAYPIPRGAWVVRRYTRGVAESPNWEQDKNGFTRCYLNRLPDLKALASTFGGVEHPQGGYVFNEAENAQKVVNGLGGSLDIPTWATNRCCKLKYSKDDRLIIEFEHSKTDKSENMNDWILEKNKWKKIVNVSGQQNKTEIEIGNYDDVVRHIVDEEGNDMGWVIYSDNQWRTEPINHVSIYLQAMGLEPTETKQVLGASVIRPWIIVNRPFEIEYPGDRQWNRKAPQFNYPPNTDLDNLHYPSWLSILEHCGSSLTDYVVNDKWCKNNGIVTGADYLKCWIASVFQKPTEPLPYLFLYGEQNSGKSILHEALSLLVTSGVVRADQALNDSSFNGELEGSVICVIEETDLNVKNGKTGNKLAYNRIKDWVTSRFLPINKKYETPYTIVNTTHWIHCSNDSKSVPIFPGDTRITMLYVPSLRDDQVIAKRDLIKRLIKEAPDFLAAILNLELPECNDRLGLPALKTADKLGTEEDNKTHLEMFIAECCFESQGNWVKYDEFYDRFKEWLDPNQLSFWSKIRTGKELDKNKFPKGRCPKTSQFYIGNISLEQEVIKNNFKYVLGPNNTLMMKTI